VIEAVCLKKDKFVSMKTALKIILPAGIVFCFAFIPGEKHTAACPRKTEPASAADSLPKKFIRVAAGGTFSIALRDDSTVWSWGNNTFGQLGCGNIEESFLPVQVSGLTGIIAISAGPDHALALKSDGTVWSWGDNTFGQLGDGTKISNRLPHHVKQLNDVVAIAAGGTHYEMVYSNSTGGEGVYGLSQGTNNSYYSMSSAHSMALKKDGTVWVWGSGAFLGGNTQHDSLPEQKEGITDIIAIAAGGFHSLALRNDGTVWAWGDNSFAQLGDDSHDNRQFPAQVLYLKDIEAISANAEHSVALTKDSTVWTWGDKPPIYNATRKFTFVPEQVKDIKGVVSVSAGDHHYLALKSDGTVLAWGMNNRYQLGSEEAKKNQYKIRVWKVSGIGRMTAVSGGAYYSMALKWDGTVWAWGYNSYGQLGNGTTKDEEYAAQCGISIAKKKKEKKDKGPAKPW
jgi:alpha-tubulin suppressor-like RCC1 family protein